MMNRSRTILLAVAVTLSACSSSKPGEADIAGTWLGTLNVSGSTLRLVFNLTHATNGSYAGTADSPDQGSIGVPLSAVDVDDGHVVLTIAGIGATFTGDVANDGASIDGRFSQGTFASALRLERQPGPLDYRRPQDPLAPYPYQTRDVSFAGAAAGVTLAGTLTWPQGSGPFKAAVLIAGSGENDRNEELLNHRPFLVLSDALTRAGIATLRYDKRGVAQSTGDYDAATTADFAADARAAVTFLRGQSDFQVSGVGLVGHSEGGLIAPMVADGNADVGFIVLLAGPGVSGDEVLVSQDRAIAAAAGVPASQLDAAEAIERRLFACFRETSDATELDRKLRAVLTAEGVTGADQDDVVATLNTPWMRYFVTADPIPALVRTTIPVLALTGSLDLQVLADLNLPPMQSALQTAGNTRATVRKLAGLNHLFQHAGTGSPAEYGAIAETMAPDVLAEISSWITTQ
jgi:alpha-beta hydrolase superfamily lysophospholipase